MSGKKKIFAVIGSASKDSSNQKLVQRFAELTQDTLVVTVFENLKDLPHFDPDLSVQNTPGPVLNFRNKIASADAVLICTPEYVFSIPSGLKNAIEWCVATTVFTDKPVGVITASARGAKGHEELLLIMKTVGAMVVEEATLLIHGIRGKINEQGLLTDEATAKAFAFFAEAFQRVVCKTEGSKNQ